MRLPEIILLLVSCNIHSFGNATKGIAAITQLTVQPLVEKLQIQWTPGNNGTPVEEFRVVLFNETKLLQNLSVGIQTNMTVDIEPCLSTTVQVCGINKKHGLRDCIYATEKSLPESFPAVLIFSIKNTPEVLGQLLNWSVVESVNENCDPYYEVTYTDNIKGFERVNTKDMFLQTFNLPQGTLIQYTVRLVCRNSSVTGNETSVTLETEPPIEPNRRYFVVRPFDTHLQLLWNSSQKAKDFLVGYVNDAEEEKFYPSNTQTWIDLNVKQQCIPSIVWIFALKDSTQPSVTTTVATQLPGNFSRSPTDVRVFPDCGSLNVTWKLESHKDYLVQYYEVKLIESRTGIVTIKNISGMWYAFVNGLKCDAPYIVFVTAINACGRSFPTNPVHVMARKEVKPNDTKSLNLTVTTNQLVVKWVREQPTYVDVVYEVHLQQMNSSSTEADEFVSVRHNEVKFERLSPCMNYSVGITVKNPFGLSSEVVESARTRAPVPSVPTDIGIQVVNRTIHNLSWSFDTLFPSACDPYFEVNVTAASAPWTQMLTTRDHYVVVGQLNYSENYIYWIRVRTELESVLSNYSGPVIMSTLPREKFYLTNFWCYIVIGVITAIIAAGILFLIPIKTYKRCCRTIIVCQQKNRQRPSNTHVPDN